MLRGRFIFYNVLALVFIKLIFSFSTFQLANIVDYMPTFDSREIISATNEARYLQGLSPLEPNLKLDLAAQEKLQDMADEGYFAHISPKGIAPWTWIKNSLYNYLYAGENLAIGFMDANTVVDAWLNSPSHRANIMNDKYDDIGVAVGAVNINGSNTLLVVQMFGTPAIAAEIQSQAKVQPQVTIQSKTTPQVSKEPPVKLQYVSTDETLEPIHEPIEIIARGTVSQNWQDIVNNVYIIYAFMIALMSVLALILKDRSNSAVLKTSLNVAILVLAIMVPVVNVSIRGLIF